MPRKKPSPPSNKPPELEPAIPGVSDDEKVAFQVRFDADLHQKLKQQAEEAGISLNQLIQGVCRACSENLHVGEFKFVNDQMKLGTIKYTKRCVTFGDPGIYISEEEREKASAYHQDRYHEEVPADRPSKIWFGLDFTDRGYVHY